MPGKSRRKRGRQPPTRKAQGRRQSPDVAQAPAPAGSVVAGVSPDAVAPAVGVSSKAVAAHQSVRHPYIGAELRTIGILAMLMLVVLVVLKLVLT